MKLKTTLMITGSFLLATLAWGPVTMANAAEVNKPAATVAESHSLSLLNGKLPLTLQGYEVQHAVGGSPNDMYLNKQEKRVVLIGEEDVPLIARAANDDDFLDGMKAIKDQEKQVSPSYTITSEKNENVNGLKVYHIEATNKMDGKDVLQTTLLSTADNKFAIIQVFSSVKDKAGHVAAVNHILDK
ncbi:DcrB/PsbP domain-containing protein [Biostraticola tofi]|uniref:Uncharacterized protein n=1 Tax=Biostraticola tofi TaxID=466109 RepID=A0A4R3YUK6_9GAMM|nr:hypothetical protein [Biostraticola tofi]TCV96765.1 hypothetical protein EDC52_104205 [Biostraticola tofi]